MIVTKIKDFLTSKNIAEYYKLYKKTELYDIHDMDTLKLEKFKKLVEHCYMNVPYYKNYMLEKGFTPKDVRKTSDVSLFPILTKEIIKENYEFFIPSNIKDIAGVKISQTGGTTGNILFKRNDAQTRSSIWATFKRFNDWMGIKERDKTLVLMGGHVIGRNFKDKLKKTFIDKLSNSISFSPYDTSEENLDNIIDCLKRNKFKLIRSYSQFLFALAKKIKSRGLTFNIKAITTTAEPILIEHRLLFKEVFNAEVFDQYGCGEIGGVAYECDKHEGLHVAEERVIVEVNEKDELILTDLDNFSMPFIRYWNADQAIFSDVPCSCGRQTKMIKQILGRTCDYIIGVNGEFLHWAYFWHLFFDSKVAKEKNLRKFQVVQEDRTLLNIRLVCDKLTTNELNVLSENIKSRLGDIKVEYSFEKNIENTKTGKYRPVINKIL